MTDRTTNPEGQEVHPLEEDVILRAFRVGAAWGAPPSDTYFVRGIPYLSVDGMLKLAEKLEQGGDVEGASIVRQRAQERGRRAYENLVARGLSGTKAEKIIIDDLGAAVPERDPVPGHVRFLIMVLLAGTGLIFSLPIIIRALFAFFAAGHP